MSLRLAAVLVPVFGSAAFAQAPGEVVPSYAVPPPPPARAYVVERAPEVNPLAERLAVGVNVGGFTAAQSDLPADGGAPVTTHFRTAELSLRYRAAPHLEVELLLSGGREVLEDDTEGNLAMGAVTVGARYRFRADRHWNWWLAAGIGGTVIENHVSSQAERDAATRAHFTGGIGVEHRWQHFAIHADARFLALGPRQDQDDVAVQPAMDDVRFSDDLTAGQLALGASLYF